MDRYAVGVVHDADREAQLGRLGELFLRAGKRLRAAEAQRFAPFGLTPAQGRVLGVLADSTEQLCMGDVAVILGVVPRAVTPQVDALEQAGLVQRRTDPHNRRSILLDLTSRGSDMCDELRGERVQAAEEIFAGLTPAQRWSLLDLLELVVPGAADDDEGAGGGD
ncbi:MAG TPA: MarR family transcriptional regulator [Streptosporangiaceae bacterium]|nr:MarR family transcriptional regulator [Streptosporangiaceae bacterium]